MLKIEHELYIVSYKHENDTQFVSPWCPQHLDGEVSWMCLLSQRMGRPKGKHTEGSGAHACPPFFLPPSYWNIPVSTFTLNLPFHSKACERHPDKPPVSLGPVSSAPHRKTERIKGLQHRKGAAHCCGLSIKNLPHCKSFWPWNHLPWPFWEPWISRILFSLFPYMFILLTYKPQATL